MCFKMGRIKVVWLCHFSNAFVNDKLDLGVHWTIRVLRGLLHKPVDTNVPEFAIWITNGIKEFEKIKDVELHIVSPYPHLKKRIQSFTSNGIHYHFFQNEAESLGHTIVRKVFRPRFYHYKRNRKRITQIIRGIEPEIVHLIGAENPYYSLGLLDIPKSIITIAQLQTLLNDPGFKESCQINPRSYDYRASVERAVIQKADYIGTRALKYREIISTVLRPGAIILNTSLALSEPVVLAKGQKLFDFVYFSADISKAADLALEAFGIAHEKNPSITLDIIGGYDQDYKHYLDSIIERLNIRQAVTFEGKLATHDDVITQIRKARFALLPLKTDLTSGTIREAMANGLPVLTTDTGEMGTQRLNLKHESVLISAIGDHNMMSDNMLRLMNDAELAEALRNNALFAISEMTSNANVIHGYVDAYYSCITHQHNNIPIPSALTVL